jgi:glycosyltransferase involved in cell wall biosynthesis
MEPVFGFILFGGGLSGALIRDVRLANELASRGYKVHVWWVMDRPHASPLRDDIEQRWLFSGLRYARLGPKGLADRLGRGMCRLFHDKNRNRTLQKRHKFLRRLMEGLTLAVVNGVSHDKALMAAFSAELKQTGVTHMLPMLGILCPWVAAARNRCPDPCKYLVTFQGYELYVNYARRLGREREIYARLRETVDRSDWPAIAVSEDYRNRVASDIGVPHEQMVAIPPGVPMVEPDSPEDAQQNLVQRLKGYEPGVPLITYLGRQDSEKGLDLLLYAAAILRSRGLRFQLAIAGPTLFGSNYQSLCKELAENLRCPVLWRNQVGETLRRAMFTASRCIVYPSVHREPFGMVAAEAMSHGTPPVVPNLGGIASAIEAHGEAGGLHFHVWDSRDLADQIERLLTDEALYEKLSEAGPRVASYLSVQLLADRVLAHVGLGQALDDGDRPAQAVVPTASQ